MELPVTRINPLEFVLPVGEHGIDVLVDHLVAGDARHHDVHEGDALGEGEDHEPQRHAAARRGNVHVQRHQVADELF